ncbi:L-alanine-DL-glutamate epimerase-like enolase superfamily enzyme [Psychromicrobium silvestre]|uniref:L-alanine-DL-glutamate epimerase-like enolase superfamily enzyme n=1 Tax=Psychromicrobium silvestre TaxID=1645614 RepID=A0A7Y9LVK4_9MICC|nr:L-alanine-DL-glutamate epimerase-like enolase superfamily enzyme [Psychromicrobium silvestre]
MPLLSPFTTSVRSATELDTVLLQLTDQDGRSGWGEVPASKVTGVSSRTSVRSLEGPLRALVLAAGNPEEALTKLAVSGEPAAIRSAMDCALHDLIAQRASLPLARLIGAGRLRLRTDMTLSVASTEELIPKVRDHLDQGFDCLKIKIDAHHDAVAALRAIRELVGPAMQLRIDANQAFEAGDAIRVIRAMEDADVGLSLVEQPVRADDLSGLALVSAAVDTPVMADESVWSMADLEELLRLKAAPMVNLKLAKTGGLLTARAMLTRALAEGLEVVIGCMLESPVAISAAAALAATLPEMAQDLDGGLWLRSSPVVGGAVYQGPEITLPDVPGLGVTALAGRGLRDRD